MNDQMFLDQTGKIGFKLSKARELCQFPIEVVSSITSLPLEKIQRLENGIESPSLPELEILAQTYQIPLPLLLGTPSSFDAHCLNDPERIKAFINLRTRIIGALLKKSQLERSITTEELSEMIGIPEEEIERYESGTYPIPEPVLALFCEKMGLDLSVFLSPISTQTESAAADHVENTETLPNDLAEFVTNAANRPYFELAKKISNMDAASLRAIAESLLEITY